MLIIRRNEAVQATIDRFFDKPFAWGSDDCAHLVAFHLRALGHADPLANVATYATRRNALKAMRRAGIKNIPDHLERTLGFEPIPPAMALPGDIVGIPVEQADADAGWLALGISIGSDRVLGYANDVCSWAPTSAATHAWRVPLTAGAF